MVNAEEVERLNDELSRTRARLLAQEIRTQLSEQDREALEREYLGYQAHARAQI